MEEDYFYFTNTLIMPKPPAEYPNFKVMLYTEIITSDDNPILHQSTTPTFETVSATTPVYDEEDQNVTHQLWMINAYAYTELTGDETLYYATGFWNDQLASDKIGNENELLWGWDATESHNSEETTTVTSDDPDQADTTQTTYTFEVATYRLFDNDLSALQITSGKQLFYKVGVKIFNDQQGDESVELANGISKYLELTVPDLAIRAMLLPAAAMAFITSFLLF